MAQTVSVQVQADNGSRRSTSFYFSDAATLAEVQASMNRHLADLDAAIDGQIVSASLVTPLSLPGTLKSAPVSGSNHDNQVRYVYTTASGYTTTKTFSTAREADIDFSADPPVPASTEWNTLTTNILNNPDTGTSPTTDYRGDDITAVKSARGI